MYYRRKMLLALLEVFDNRLEKINFQKLLMLVTKQQLKPDYQFVPYKYGCFSFQANADLLTMAKYNMIREENNSWVKINSEKHLENLKERDRKAIRYIKQLYGNKSPEELIKLSYIKYPYYAINSLIAKERLSDEEYQKVLDAKPKSDDTILYTIGYEGSSLEEYLNQLISRNINLLCDVRKNSFSMKYGFSKSQLENACNSVGILYKHIPELGIESDQRKELHNQTDYDILFDNYKKEVLPHTTNIQESILNLLMEKKRIALTCFEADVNKCHRKHLALTISRLPGFNFKLKHL